MNGRRIQGLKSVAIAVGTLAMMMTTSAYAGESLFSRVYNVETTPQGSFELEQLVRNRSDRSYGSYVAEDLSTELEYGFTDNFQGAFYLLYGRVDMKNSPDDNDPEGDQGNGMGINRHLNYFQGGSAEFIYRVLNPVKDPIGLAFYYEPSFQIHDQHDGLSYRNFENEYRIMLQKNFLDDRLIVAYNIVGEIEMYRYFGSVDDTGPTWVAELDWNNELGATYRIASNWYAGWEARNHNELNDFSSHDHSVFWTGPALHYAAKRYWMTLGVLRQVYGDPGGLDEAGDWQGKNLFLHSHEKWESTFKIGFPF